LVVVEDEPVAIPHKDLHAVEAATEEYEEVPVNGLSFQSLRTIAASPSWPRRRSTGSDASRRGHSRAQSAVFIRVSDIDVRVEVGTDVAYVADLVSALRSRC